MSRSWQLFLQDIEEETLKVKRRTQGVSFEHFFADDVLYDAVIRNLEIIGEAAKGLPADVRARAPGVDWRGVAGLRDVLAHSYFAIDDETLWDIIQNKLPQLLAAVKQIRGEDT